MTSTPSHSGDHVEVNRNCRIPVSELSWRTSRSGGPGGQHANTSDTRVEVVFDVAGSASLRPGDRRRLRERFGDQVTAVAGDERSQTRNRALALDRLRQRLAGALVVKPSRRPTRPTAGSRRRRLDAKSKRSETKRLRRPPTD